MRAFFALEIPDEVRARIGMEMEGLRRQLPRARWVRPAALHLTVKFLGQIEVSRLSALTTEIGAAVTGAAAVGVTLAGSGFFPGPARPRVAWLGGTAQGAAELSRRVEEAAGRQGFDEERRPWRLHLTLARLRSPWPAPASEAFLEWGRGFRAGPFICRDLVLFESRLRPEGAVYTVVERVPLTGGGEGPSA